MSWIFAATREFIRDSAYIQDIEGSGDQRANVRRQERCIVDEGEDRAVVELIGVQIA